MKQTTTDTDRLTAKTSSRAASAGKTPPRLATVRQSLGRLAMLGFILIYLSGSLSVAPVFADTPDSVTIAVEQVFTNTGVAVPRSEDFVYWLYAADASNPMPAGTSGGHYAFSLHGDETLNAATITFYTPGVYTYYLSCIISAVPDYSYDRQVYTIDVHVFDDFETIIIIKNGLGEKTEGVVFSHAFGLDLLDPEAMVDPPVEKTVTGVPNAEGLFTFRLTADNPLYPMPAGSVGGVKTIQISGSGVEEFGTWSYVQEGVFKYTVAEVNTGTAGYTYDSEVYTITDNVRFTAGHLVVDRVITKRSGGQVDRMTYQNDYAPGETVTIAGSKTWQHGTRDARFYPKTITVLVRANGVAVASRQITAADNWSWSFNMDKYDNQGHEIFYTIDEVDVPNYRKVVAGYSITNTYVEPVAPKPPFTGDQSNAALYSGIFGAAGVVALLCLWYLLTERRRRGELAMAVAMAGAGAGAGVPEGAGAGAEGAGVPEGAGVVAFEALEGGTEAEVEEAADVEVEEAADVETVDETEDESDEAADEPESTASAE